MEKTKISAIEKNVFPKALESIDIEKFPWHNYRGNIDSDKLHSSQALCIDVFGTLGKSKNLNLICRKMAEDLNIPGDGPWEIKLEWKEKDNLLKERRPTQIDAVAISPQSIILFECKFTENLGSCSQTKTVIKGGNKGKTPCNGNYAQQINSANGKESFCALTGKGILYWKHIPKIFHFDCTTEYNPCPFRKNWFQLMRNLTMADAIPKKAAVIVLYPEHPKAQTKKWHDSAEYQEFCTKITKDAPKLVHYSYQKFIEKLKYIDPESRIWVELQNWVDGKIKRVFEK